MAEETSDDFTMDRQTFGLVGDLMEASSRQLAWTTNNLIDSWAASAAQNASLGLEACAMLRQATGNRLTMTEHYHLENIEMRLEQAFEHASRHDPLIEKRTQS